MSSAALRRFFPVKSPHTTARLTNNRPTTKYLSIVAKAAQEGTVLKATGIVRRIDELGRVVIPKEIRRTLRIREGDPSQISLTPWEKFCFGMLDLAKRQGW